MLERRKLFSNSLAMFVNRLVQAVGTFVLTAAIVRILGAETLGQYLLAASYYFIFVSIASQGLRTLFTRELSRNLEEISVYLVSGTALQFVLSTVAYLILVFLIWLLPYNPETSMVCYIFGFTIIPFSLSNITEAIFQAQERMHLIAASAIPIYILRLIIMILLMQSDYGVHALAGVMIVSETLILIIQWLILLRSVKPVWRIDWAFILHIISTIKTFFAIEATGMIAAKMDILILSLVGSELLVGIYSGMAQLIQPYEIIVSSLGLATFPRMAKAVEKGKEQQQRTTEDFIEFLLLIAVPTWIGFFFFGEDLLNFIYRDPSFNGTGLIFWINAFTIILSPFIRILGYVLIVNGLERFNLLEVITTVIVGGLSGTLLISHYQLLGAALMGIILSFSACSIISWAVYTYLFPLNIFKIFYRPLLISGLMLPIFWLLKMLNVHFLGVLIISAMVYLLLISCLGVYILGGPRSVLDKLLRRT